MSVTEQFPAAASGSTPDRRGQGTMVEQARAAAEVQAQVYLAREFPRDIATAKKRMLEACAQSELAEAAFYSYPRGGETVSGLTIVAACELALIWGNIVFGLTEMRRDDEYGQSEMQAYAWELETNARIASTFIVTHFRDTKKGSYRLKDGRDIYEKNANEGNRRMRAAVLKVLPRWYVLAAERALNETLKRSVQDSGKPLPVQIRETGSRLFRDYGITPPQIEHKFNRPLERWTAEDLVQLRILGDSLDRGEIRVDEAFPQAKVTPEEIQGGSPPAEPEVHVHGEDPALWDPNCMYCVEQAGQLGVTLKGGEPLHGAMLMRQLEAAMRAAGSAGELEGVYARAVKHRDAGSLTVDEFTQVEVARSQRDRELAGEREADREVSGDA